MTLTSDSSELKEEDIIELFTCGECDYSASSENDLQQHKVSQHVFKAMFGFIEKNVCGEIVLLSLRFPKVVWTNMLNVYGPSLKARIWIFCT